ncbi:MAG: lysoplasmalogenase [Aeromicrobium sp.]|nr:lysoplasmalogenase [Aeromicrobium sp.]
MLAVRSRWLVAFAVVSVAHLALDAARAEPWDSVTKCFIAPLLAAWVLGQRGPRALVVALTFCCIGDLLLELDDLFIAGMAAFAAAHVCFITIFARRGAAGQLRRKPWIIAVYLAAAGGLVAWCWRGLEADLRPIVPVYAVLLVGTAAASLATDVRAGAGGLMFLVSDGIIALGEADRIDQDATATGLAIMVLYVLAIFGLSTGIVRRERLSLAAGPGFDATVRTDCWPRLPARKA